MATTLLAGDIGATKTNLGLYALAGGEGVRLLREATYQSRQYRGLEEVVGEFVARGGEPIDAAAFGVPGPVIDECVRTTNLPWIVRTASLREALDCQRVRLMNDLETTASGALFLPAADLLTLNEGHAHAGNRAVIAAGTGLGQAMLFWDGTRHRPSATEGGHVDFAPRDEREMRLLEFLRTRYGHVSYERVLTGTGLVDIVRFLDETLGRPVAAVVRERMQREDPAAVVGEAGVTGSCATCVEAVEMFVSIYGAQAGNLALTVMATGGVYVGGGIVTKLVPKMTSGTFLRGFVEKGRYRELMEAIPVQILLNPKTSQLGAAHVAAGLLDATSD